MNVNLDKMRTTPKEFQSYLPTWRFHVERGKRGAYTRRRGLDRAAKTALLLIQAMMRELKADGLMRKVGDRGSRWFPPRSRFRLTKRIETHRNASSCFLIASTH